MSEMTDDELAMRLKASFTESSREYFSRIAVEGPTTRAPMSDDDLALCEQDDREKAAECPDDAHELRWFYSSRADAFAELRRLRQQTKAQP